MAEQRLPQIDGDDGQWGILLNQFLAKEHYNTGSDDTANGGHKTVTIKPGVATTGGAPLKFTSGTLLSTPEAGAMEFAGDNYYLTQTSSTTRKKIAIYDDASGATGDTYYRNGSGYFTRLPVGSNGDYLTVTSGVPAWTGTFAVKDASFTLQDDTDTTKQAQFQLSGNTTGTTRTYSLPDATTTLLGTNTITTKGDLYAGTGAGTVSRHAAGVDNYLLAADSTQSTGLKWVSAPWSSITDLDGGNSSSPFGGTLAIDGGTA